WIFVYCLEQFNANLTPLTGWIKKKDSIRISDCNYDIYDNIKKNNFITITKPWCPIYSKNKDFLIAIPIGTRLNFCFLFSKNTYSPNNSWDSISGESVDNIGYSCLKLFFVGFFCKLVNGTQTCLMLISILFEKVELLGIIQFIYTNIRLIEIILIKIIFFIFHPQKS
ncbi:hypothetical protein KJ644_03680, partial [Candidatus Dependentiae bacterium]|nr:hypothetical protein [Candidatus Dependentiae bacterium]